MDVCGVFCRVCLVSDVSFSAVLDVGMFLLVYVPWFKYDRVWEESGFGAWLVACFFADPDLSFRDYVVYGIECPSSFVAFATNGI